MRALALAIVLATLVFQAPVSAFAASPPSPVRANGENGCQHSWTRGKLKSYKQIEREVREKYADGKILRIALCRNDTLQYYQVQVLSGSGAVHSLKIPAE